MTNPSIDEMGLIQFRSQIFSDFILKPKILQGACDLVKSDRKCNESMVDHSLLRQAIDVFHALMVYTKDFEPILLGESQEYFISWADQESSTRGLASYVEECHKLIDRETSRCDMFGLDSSTRRELLTKLEEILIRRKEGILVKTESVSELLKLGSIDSLERLHSLLQRERLGAKLRPSFESYINATGSAIVFDEERESDMVVRLLEFKGKLDLVWRVAFHKHEGLGHSLREAFETFINKTKKTNMTWGTDNPKPGEMIAKYVDMLLRGGAKAIPATLSSAGDTAIGREEDDADGAVGDEDAEISKQLDQVLDLFRFVHGKAVFEAFYKKDLARRLLMGRSASAEAEKSMLTRLKTGKRGSLFESVAVLICTKNVVPASPITLSRCSETSTLHEMRWLPTKACSRNDRRRPPWNSVSMYYPRLRGPLTPMCQSMYHCQYQNPLATLTSITRQSILEGNSPGNTPWLTVS